MGGRKNVQQDLHRQRRPSSPQVLNSVFGKPAKYYSSWLFQRSKAPRQRSAIENTCKQHRAPSKDCLQFHCFSNQSIFIWNKNYFSIKWGIVKSDLTPAFLFRVKWFIWTCISGCTVVLIPVKNNKWMTIHLKNANQV